MAWKNSADLFADDVKPMSQCWSQCHKLKIRQRTVKATIVFAIDMR